MNPSTTGNLFLRAAVLTLDLVSFINLKVMFEDLFLKTHVLIANLYNTVCQTALLIFSRIFQALVVKELIFTVIGLGSSVLLEIVVTINDTRTKDTQIKLTVSSIF